MSAKPLTQEEEREMERDFDAIAQESTYAGSKAAALDWVEKWARRLTATLDAEREKSTALAEALVALVRRLDAHFGGPSRSSDWKEQEDARAALAQYGAATDSGFARNATEGQHPAATTAKAAPTDGRTGEWVCCCNGEGKCGYCAEEAVCRAEALGDVRQERGLDGEWEGEETP